MKPPILPGLILIGMSLGGAVGAAEPPAGQLVLKIEAQPLEDALNQFAQQSGLQVLISSEDAPQGVRVPKLVGAYTADEALKELLEYSGLRYEFVNPRTVAIRVREKTGRAGGEPPAALGQANLLRLAQAPASPESLSGASTAEQTPVGERERSPEELDEVVVLGAKRKFAPTDSSAATKIKMDILDTPQSLSILSSELIDIIGVSTGAQAAAWAPGVISNEGETQVWDDTSARGFFAHPYNSQKINGLSYQRVYAPDLGVVERYEIVRGPAAIVYGQSAYGATLSYDLKKPSAKPAFSGQLGLGISGAYRGLVDVTGALTENGRLRGRFIAIQDNQEGSQYLSFSRTSTISPSISWDMSENTTLDANAYHGERDFRRANGFSLIWDADTAEYSLPDISKDAFMGAAFGRSKSSFDFITASVTHNFNEDWVAKVSGLKARTYLNWYEPFVLGPAQPDGEVSLYDFEQVSYTNDSSADLTLTGNFEAFGRKNSLMLNGLVRSNREPYFSTYCCNSIGTLNILDPDPESFQPAHSLPGNIKDAAPSAAIYDQYTKLDELSWSAMLLLRPVDRLTVMLGARLNQFKSAVPSYYDRSISRQNPARFKNDAWNTQLGLVYEIHDNFNLYASYSDGTLFRAVQDAAGNALPPEKGVQLEVGAKAGLLDRKLTVSAGAFTIDRRNVAVGDPNFPNQPFSIAIDGQKHKGVELEAIGEPAPGWNIITSYSYLDINIDMPNNPLGWNGHQQANSPHHMFKLYTTYQLLNGPLHGLSLGGGLFRVSEREVDNGGTFQLPAYTRVDLRLGYDAFKNYSFSINAMNIADEKIYTSFWGSVAGGIDLQSRRTLMFRVNFNY